VLSPKQIEILKWPYTGHRALICDGAVRSGKTSVMSLSFLLWAMGAFDRHNFAICGKTVGSAERNIIQPLQAMTYLQDHFLLTYSRSEHMLTVRRGGRSNRFYVFGGRDESSYTLIQGITADFCCCAVVPAGLLRIKNAGTAAQQQNLSIEPWVAAEGRRVLIGTCHRSLHISCAEKNNPRHKNKGFLNRRFKRAFGYFSPERKVTRGPGPGRPRAFDKKKLPCRPQGGREN